MDVDYMQVLDEDRDIKMDMAVFFWIRWRLEWLTL